MRNNAGVEQKVQVGQVWKDNDKRNPNRFLKVVRVIEEGSFVGCVEMQQVEPVNYRDGWLFTAGSKPRRVSIKRLRPTANGYVLVTE